MEYEEKDLSPEPQASGTADEDMTKVEPEEEASVPTDMEDGTEPEAVCGPKEPIMEGAPEGAEPAAEPVQQATKKGKGFMAVVLEYLQAILMAFLIAIVIMAFIGRSYMVEGASMEKTLFNSERVLVEKISYYIGDPDRGDIVVLMNPRQQKYGNWFYDTFGFVKDIFVSDMSTRPYIKRVIGIAGDKVEVKGGRTYLNDELLEEPYVSEEIWWDYGPYYVPEGYVFVMGDNRNHSDDSRSSVGFLKIDRILGKAVARFWPLNKLTLFQRPDLFKDM